MRKNPAVFAAITAMAAMMWISGCGNQDPMSSQSERSDSPAAKLVISRTKAGRGLGAGVKHPTAFSAVIAGNQEVPAVTTKASGTGSFTLNGAKTELRFKITVRGLSLSANSAHFHNGAAGVSGGVVRSFSGSEAAGFGKDTYIITGIWSSTDAMPLTPVLVKALEAGNIYVDFHTTAHGSGEIRGQLKPQ